MNVIWLQLDPEVKAAFDVAYNNIHCFHAAQQKTQPLQVETMPVGADYCLFFVVFITYIFAEVYHDVVLQFFLRWVIQLRNSAWHSIHEFCIMLLGKSV